MGVTWDDGAREVAWIREAVNKARKRLGIPTRTYPEITFIRSDFYSDEEREVRIY